MLTCFLNGKCRSTVTIVLSSVADLHSNILDVRPQLGPIFFIFMQFLANFGQIIGWSPPDRHSPLGNSGSTSVLTEHVVTVGLSLS